MPPGPIPGKSDLLVAAGALTLPHSPRTFGAMTEGKSNEPRLSAAGRQARAERQAREGEALRANLRRRKAQTQARDEAKARSPAERRDPSGDEPGEP
ncbi:MAG: hypothetical protein ACE5DS_08370 [Kiloniellaceae bacterium]